MYASKLWPSFQVGLSSDKTINSENVTKLIL